MKIIRWLDENFEKTLIVIIFAAFTLIIIKEVFTRFFLNYTTDWAEELCRGMFVYMIFLAASYCCRHRKHLKMGLFDAILGERGQRVLNLFSDLLFLILIYFVVSSSWNIVVDSFRYNTLVQSGTLMKYNFNLGYLTFSISFGWALMGIRIIQRQILEIKDKLNFEEKLDKKAEV